MSDKIVRVTEYEVLEKNIKFLLQTNRMQDIVKVLDSLGYTLSTNAPVYAIEDDEQDIPMNYARFK